jgi:ribosomal protein L25 (general stress protein Ctc)
MEHNIDASVRAKNEKRDKTRVPAIIYGNNSETKCISITLQQAQLIKNLSLGSICRIMLVDEEIEVKLQSKQLHPISKNIIHIDFIYCDNKSNIRLRK